ncbi:MAG: UDP-2,3-diacylglucosamine diphosphatase [Rikenellaceae bacterium]
MYYFASDIHLGGGGREIARQTEIRFVEWLERVAVDAEAIILCGDVFDFWFEYRLVVPRGFTRALGTISRLIDRGVRIIFMSGNHDMWQRDYLREECGLEVYTAPTIFEFGGRRVHIAHGDNLNVKKDWKLKLMNSVFRSKFIFHTAARFIHPDLMLKFGIWWSENSRNKHTQRAGHNTIDGDGVLSLVEYATQRQQIEPCDYYVFGHLHQNFIHHCDGFDVVFTNDWSQDPHFAKLNSEGQMSLERV